MAESITRQQRRARERELARRMHSPKRSRTPLLLAAAGVFAVLAVFAGLVIVKLADSSAAAPVAPAGAAPAAVVQKVSSIPAAVFNRVGYQSDVLPAARISGPPLTADGKPLVVYIGAEYCPYCAAERWAVVAALSRFGRFQHLGATHSSSIDVYPSTPTFSFHGATYSSPYLTLQAVETATNQPDGQSYVPLDTPTAAQQALLERYDTAAAIPFVDLGNRYVIAGASYSPQLLAGLTMRQIADQLDNPSSALARSILGTANSITAVLCAQTGGRPQNVCSSSAVVQSAAKLQR